MGGFLFLRLLTTKDKKYILKIKIISKWRYYMYYSVFAEIKNSSDIKKILNLSSREEVMEKVGTPFLKGEEFEAEGEKIKKDDIEKLLIVETAIRQLGDYKLVERFIKETQTYGEKFVNEKYPGFFVKDITEEILK